jgi:hypothetical protein
MWSRTQPSQRPADPAPLVSRATAATRCLVALGFIASFLAIGIGAALTAAQNIATLLGLELCCLLPIGLAVVLELWPAVLVLQAGTAALRRLQDQLGALPEAPHPLGPRQHTPPQPIPSTTTPPRATNNPEITTPNSYSNEKTETRATVPALKMNDRYVDWRKAAAAAADAYQRWSSAPPAAKTWLFRLYTAALDQEESTATSLALAAKRQKRQTAP